MPVTPMNDISALQVPGGNLNWKILSLLFQKPKAFPAVADFRPGGDSEISLLPPTEMQKIITCIHKI